MLMEKCFCDVFAYLVLNLFSKNIKIIFSLNYLCCILNQLPFKIYIYIYLNNNNNNNKIGLTYVH